MSEEKLILVVNDDGVTAPGIKALVEAVKGLGKVIVVAPDSPQSGMGHAITIGNPLRLEKVHLWNDEIEAYQCSGTPVDCVKLAVDKVLHRKPDLCVSGINHGSNSSINVIYSGTMSAAMEAAIEGIPAIGFSLLDYDFDADFSAATFFAKQIAEKILTNKLPEHSLLNVNIPKLPTEKIKGVKVCRQSIAKWVEDTDEWALANDFVSVVPVQFDLTAHQHLKTISKILL